MSDEQAMRGILQERLLTLGWAGRTAFEGKGFTGAAPDAETPYQEVSTVFAEPVARSLAHSSDYSGQFQVRILWPVADVKANGIGAPHDRAKAIKAAFPRNLKLSKDGQTVKIMRDAAISRGPVQGDRDVTLVRIRFSDR